MNKAKLKNIISMVNTMAHEVNLYIGKTILANGQDDKYASRYEILPMEVNFYLYNIETCTIACKGYSFEDFCNICSDNYKMQSEFSELSNKLMDRTSCKSKEIIYIERGLII